MAAFSRRTASLNFPPSCAGSAKRAIAVAKKIRTGMVSINGGGFNMKAPFGGYKQSGNGREFGKWGLEDFLEVKSLQFKRA